MSDLHTALKSLSPIAFSDLPTSDDELSTVLTGLFSDSETILDSIPIQDAPQDASTASTTDQPHPYIAHSASEMKTSIARPPPPPVEHQSLQKEWGKPIKLSAKENPLGISVYKASAKDGRGAWFARRSILEGLPYARFRSALKQEFEQSLAVQGAPGEGNVRGIGGEIRVVSQEVKGQGKIEVFRLSAQFPGPTTPRDFVTLLVTSDSALESHRQGAVGPRHYMIISKPCDHPETQPQSGFIRGFYESVEFIREVPKKGNVKVSASLSDLTDLQNSEVDGSISKKAIVGNANQKAAAFSDPELTAPNTEDEDSAVEWIMVTRSDPGGSVPRFMVERGTPSSIVADASKFLDWACQLSVDEKEIPSTAGTTNARLPVERRDSYQTWRRSRIAGAEDQEVQPLERSASPQNQVPNARASTESGSGSFMGAVSGAASYLSSYTPQVVLDRLPGNTATSSSPATQADISKPEEKIISTAADGIEDDAESVTNASFASADSHLDTEESDGATGSSLKSTEKKSGPLTQHEKELQKLEQRRADLTAKFAETQTKFERDASTNNAKEEAAQQKAIEKHQKEVKRQEERYEKELKKLQDRQEKERKKMEEKKKRLEDKDEKARLTRERDEARQELEIAKKEATVLRQVVEDLQKENTTLVAKLGRIGAEGSELDELRSEKSSGRKRDSKSSGHSHTHSHSSGKSAVGRG